MWLCATTLSYAQQEPPPLAVEARGGAAIVVPIGSFTSIPGIPAPSQLTFSSQSGSTRPWFGFGADVPLSGNWRIGARVGGQSQRMIYSASERVPIATENGVIYLATLQHDLKVNVTALSIEPLIRFSPRSWLAVTASIPFLIPTLSDYVQTQRFTDPNGLSFIDGSVEQTTGAGATPNLASIVPGLAIGAEALLPLTHKENLLLTPQIGYSLMFGSFNGDGALRTQSVSFGIGIRYVFGVQDNGEDTVATADAPLMERVVVVQRDTIVGLSAQVRERSTTLESTRTDSIVDGNIVRVTIFERYQTLLPKPPAVLRGSLRLAFVHDDGSVRDDARVSAQRYRIERTVPFMPLVVFDAAVSTIPARYVQLSATTTIAWKEQTAITEAVTHWQYNVLNIIGFRLRLHPTVACSLVTYDDGTDAGKGLAQERCEALQTYLVQTWGISPKKLFIKVLKGQASQPAWVMFVDATRILLKPLVATSVQNESRLPQVRVMPEVISEAGVRRWSINMLQSGRAVRTFSDTGSVPTALVWNMNDNLETDAVLSQQILIELRLDDMEGASTRSEPGRIVMRSQSLTDATGIAIPRTEVLRVLPPDFISTPDAELFEGAPAFTSVEFYPATMQDNAEYLLSGAPVIKKPLDAAAWFRRGLVPPEKEFYQRAELYIKEERR